MNNYKKLHDSLTRKILDTILNDKKINISLLNSNNIVLISITFFIVFFLFFIIYLLYKSNFISLLDWNELTLNIIKTILSLLFIVSLYSLLTFWYIFYFYNLIKHYKTQIIKDKIFYWWIKIFWVISIVITIIIFIFLKFDKNLTLFNELSHTYSKYTIYGYFWLFWISVIILWCEYVYKYRNDLLDLFLLIKITILTPKIWYKIVSRKEKRVIYNSLLKIDKSELEEINPYLIYWNRIENFIKLTLIIVGWFYFIVQLIIWKISLNTEKIIDLIKKDIPFSITLFIWVILLFFIYKIFLTPSFIRNTYYVYLKEDKKLSDI